jgi:quinol monooxygenase YgiN
MIYVIATVELSEGGKEKYLAELKRVTPLVHKEKGCLEYGPTVERWESLEALKAHLTQPHFLEYRERVKDVMKSVSIQVLKPA